ncbi:MAG TPA: DUF1080 domain-containing protein [Bryobacteraceae bacterium]|nr:DUF1080 domain-containing protein [Bryobacteraceae bacterium]
MRLLCSVFLLALSCLSQESRSALEADPRGWRDLTPAKNWKRVPIPSTAALQSENQWRYDRNLGLLICTGDKGHELLRSNREYKDFILHVEWRFRRAEGKEQPRYNSGVMVRSSADGEHFVQAQVGGGPNAWLFADYPVDGKKQRTNLRDSITAERVRPAGEWNVYELTVRGSAVSLWVNGATVGSYDKVPAERGYIGVEAEGFYIEWGNIRMKELK